MSGAMMMFYISILYLLFKDVSSQEVTLAPEHIDVMENTNVTLTCTTHELSSSWTNSKNLFLWPLMLQKGDMCIVNGFLNNSLLYSWNCHLNGSFSLTILKVNEKQHNKTWNCRGINFSPVSNTVTVNVQVRVKNVQITTPTGSNVTVIENMPTQFRCMTSYSRPTPSIKWFMRLKGNTNQINASDSIEIISDEKGLTAAISVLNISVNREKQGADIYCNGTNGIKGDVVSRNIKIEVYYAPDRGPVIEKASNNSIYTLKENHTCNLTCAIAWANPLPQLSWNCDGTKKYSYEDKRDVRLNIQWQAQRDGDKVCTCTATQEVSGVQRTSIRIEVLYPPIIETIKFERDKLHQDIQVNESIKVIEKETYILKCEARSKPKPSYKWTGMIESNVSSITIINPQTPQTYTETCHAINVMEFNNTEKETGNMSRNVQVEVLYPPKINTLVDKRVTEGSDVEIRCPTTHGNPTETSYIWTREGDDSQWLSNTLKIQNVSRKDSMGYTCTANNVMVMTGNIRKIGSSSKNMTLEVLYPPDRPSLFLVSIAGMKVNMPITDTLIVAEHTPFTLLCNASSVPKPNRYLWDPISTQNSSIVHIPGLIRNDKHRLTCHVSNVMIPTEGSPRTGGNNVTVSIDIQFSPDIENMTNIISEEGTNVNFSCPLINGNPKNTSVMWVRNNDEQKWLKPNFSLKNVSRTDSSIYTCTVNNTMIMTGDVIKEGVRNKSIKMNVLYKVLILDYQAVNYSTNDAVTVAENETVKLKCEMEGNPAPVGMILSKEQLEVTKSIEENYTTYSVTFKATCSHKGVYTCRGRNVINQERISERNISLYVTCSPRQDPTSPLRSIVQTSRNEALIVNFTVLAYPKPTIVLVKKYNGLSWLSVNNSDNFEITQTGLDIWFTIHRIAKEDYGKYQLTISNDYGEYKHIFYVEPTSMESSISEPPSISSVNYGLVVGLPLVILAIIAVLVIGVIIYRKRNTGVPDKLIYQNVPFTGKTRKVKKKYESQRFEHANSEELQEIDDVPHDLTEPTEYYNSPDKIEQIDRIKVSELVSYVSEKSYESFGIEYQKLPSGIQKPCTFARKPENLPLNRYNGIYPYDHSRVKFPSCPDFFMNACYIDGYKRKNAYIASLGPTTKTTNDFQTFWQMVWHAETDVIVMLTNLNEPSGMKCEQYWPPDGSDMDYGDICVKSKSVKVLAEYTVRTFHIIKDGRKRSLTHLHFTAWPDKTVPEDTTCLLEFRTRMKSIPTSSKGPIIVHCSAGIGRTGTLIAIDRLIEEGQDIESVNVFGCVEALRDQRVKMVQTLEQYVYIYKALVNALVFGCETIPIGRFKNNVTQNNDTIYNKHYKQLSQSVEEEKKEDSDARAKNKRLAKYNRQGADVPGLRFRVMLCLTRQCGDHDYINAVYMNTHAKKDHLIIAQTPLPDTVEDFICMIYNENCTCIVTMEDLQEPGAMIGQYVSENKHPKSYGNFTVVCSRLETKDEYIVRQMKIKYNGRIDSSEKVAYHFQYTKWMPGQDTPVSAIEFLHFIEKVENYDSEFSDNYSHILVHCLRANERSGLFCAVKILKEKIREENEINVGNVLKHLRTRRRTAVTSMEQVKFCYQAVGAFIKMLKQ